MQFFLEKPDGWKFSIFIKKPRWRKWGSHLGSLTWVAWRGVGEKRRSVEVTVLLDHG
jgi:hypothetical protein